MSNLTKDQESFRDHVSTIDEKGKRVWITPKKPSGRFHNYRLIVSWVLLAIFFISPHIKINGEPLFLFQIFERKFNLFGVTFWPQDFHLFMLIMITLIVFIILFTVVYGRLWCGWTCPQTIFMEMIYRKVEYLIDGDRAAQLKLKKQGWNARKIFKRALKHGVFIVISIILVNNIIAYFVGFDRLVEIMKEPVGENLLGFIAMIVFSFLFYFIYMYFREQLCLIVCPYGRLQGVFMDRDSVIVGYDYKRGEKRGGKRKNQDREAEGLGDCVDCHACVNVCPTGIDIRNGTQMECVSCTACIDACNSVMAKNNLPKGLIRYASERSIAEGEKHKIRPKSIAYSAFLLGLLGVLILLFSLRADVEATIVRASGSVYTPLADGNGSNTFQYQVVNKSSNTLNLEFRLMNYSGTVNVIGNDLVMEPKSVKKGVAMIVIPGEEIQEASIKLDVGVYDGEKLIDKVRVSFMGPLHGK